MTESTSSRDPSLHCKLSSLETLLSELVSKGEVTTAKSIKDLAWEMLTTLNQDSPNHRMVVTKAKKAVVAKAGQLDKEVIESFNLLFYNKRKALKHKSVVLVTDQHPDYARLIGCTEKAVEFSNAFYDGDYPAGFNNYLHHAGDILGPRLTLRTLLNSHSRIMEKGEEINSIRNSEYADLARDVYTHFTEKSRKNSGLQTLDYSKSEEYIHFIKAAELITKHKATAKDWVDALFAGVAWTGKMPLAKDLHSNTAPQHYANYKKNLKK